MSTEYSSKSLLTFLRKTTLAGHIPPAVAKSRRAAADTLFEKLTESESADLRQLNIDALSSRFLDIQGGGLRSEVVELYADRLRAALDDFFRYVESPHEFVSLPAHQDGARRREEHSPRSREERAMEAVRLSAPSQRPDVVPVPLEVGRVVYLHGIPADLTPQEAGKISRVVAALANEPGDEN